MKKIRIKRRGTPSVWNKCFRIMKLTALFLLIGLMQVSASLYSQTTMLTLEMRNKKVVEVLEEIEKQSEFRFAYSSELIDLERKVSVELNERNIEETLNVIFDGTGVKHVVYDRHIMLYPQEMDSYSESVSQQQNTITGKVTDESGQPLPGVTVVIKGTTQGTVTDMDGNYSISNIPENATLVFSFVGMKSQEKQVAGNTSINVAMQEETFGIEEVVAIGYGTQKKINITGAVDVISNEQIQNRQSPTVSQLLQGQVPSLDVSIGNRGFEPGATLGLDIRGMGSINGGSPYVVIDGFPGDMNRLNPEDIESISVLKDAAASAIYGARAPYGVILITTKSGSKNKKLTATYSGSVSINTAQRLPDMPDSYTHARVMNEAAGNLGGAQVHRCSC